MQSGARVDAPSMLEMVINNTIILKWFSSFYIVTMNFLFLMLKQLFKLKFSLFLNED